MDKIPYRRQVRCNGSRCVCEKCCCCGNAFMTREIPISLADNRYLWLCKDCTKLFNAKYKEITEE